MTLLVFLVLIILLVILLNIQSTVRTGNQLQQHDIADIKNQLQHLRHQLDFFKTSPSQPTTPVIDPVKEQQEKEAAALKAQEEHKQKIKILQELERVREEKKKANAAKAAAPVVVTFTPEETVTAPPRKTAFEKWSANNPDMEKFIGENLFNKIGIAVLVFGIAFFVKYAIDKDWINEYGRVAIGLLCGITLVSLAHKLRNTYRSFSSVLAGGGIAVFYFTIALAFHQYHIISQLAAFIIMIVITGFAVALSVLYNKLELAVIAVAGGFLTPFLVSTGQGNYKVLFTYLIILNLGLLALARFKKWPLVNILALFFTIIIYGGWMLYTFTFSNATPPHLNALLFATAFYIIFIGSNTLFNISKKLSFKAFDFFIVLLINITYYAAGMIILQQWHGGDYKGIFTICLGAINLSMAVYCFRLRNVDKNLLYLLIGLALSYLSLTAPVQLQGHSITLFWCAEMVLLLWLYQRSQIRLFKIGSLIITVLMCISLGMDWQYADGATIGLMPVIFTNLKGIATNITAIAAFAAYGTLLHRKKTTPEYMDDISTTAATIFCFVAAAALTYLTCYFGINLYFVKGQSYTLPNVYHQIITYVAVLIILFAFKNKPGKFFIYLQLALALIAFLFYFGSSFLIEELRLEVLACKYKMIHLLMHWFGVLLLCTVLFSVIQLIRANKTLLTKSINNLSWAISIAAILLLSFEGMQLYTTMLNGITDSDVLTHQYKKAGLTITWGLCSFALMWLGMRYKYKTLRIISIVLFAVALIKLFLFDIRNISPGGKIAAFIMLGILLLIVSFMYQRLKKILIDETAL
jgi:uncharacterized membrane protein